MPNEWIISDTHFGHYDIVGFCSRPFQSLHHMDEAMIARWQGSVHPDDTIYHLGDVGKATGSYDLAKVVARLPGRKVLVRGNHDKNPEAMRGLGFDVVCEEMFIKCQGVTFRLIHKPQLTPAGAQYVLHGHIHNSTPEHRAAVGMDKKGELIHIPPFNINMCVEMWNYTPVSLPWLVKELARRQREENKRQGMRMS
jgi:calcineurin-like phosphoesterase family protein